MSNYCNFSLIPFRPVPKCKCAYFSARAFRIKTIIFS